MRRTCPYPYADDDDEVTITCLEGTWDQIVDDLVYEATVSDLNPYLRYECIVDAVNEMGGLESPPSVIAKTLPAG